MRDQIDEYVDDVFTASVDSIWRKIARPNQLPPDGNWSIWLILSGRGFGKSRAVNEWAIEQARLRPRSRGALVAATAGDVRDVVVEGESGIMNIAPSDFMPLYEPSKRRLTFPNGSIATTFSADEPNRLRGPQFHWAICDELAAWNAPEAALDMLLMGVRLGQDPRIAISTTPRPIPVVSRLLQDPTCAIVRGSTYENRANLAPKWFSDIISKYAGTRLGRQEIDGEVLDDVLGALWKRNMIVNLTKAPEAFRRVVVAIDPAASNIEGSAETGIIVSAIDMQGHFYVLDDRTISASPLGWAQAAIAGYYLHKADRLVAEANNGGDMVESTVRTVDRNVSFRKVFATRGKALRAEPIAALYEQGRVSHIGVLRELEDQMCNWVPGVGDSPDRVDALVWSLTELLGGGGMQVGVAPEGLAEHFGG